VLLFNAIRGAIIFICEMFCRSLAERKCKKKKTMSDFRNCADSRLQALPFTRFSSAAAATTTTHGYYVQHIM
jgi:hypothetical protein